ncbi:MAG: hypothetical protein H6873_01835 [Hyphomicrobiaceae bacterium]|nr:hypothetical protein [Hyphomicrobiaceae bacterium]
MANRSNVAQLRHAVSNIETMTRFALAVLALASGVYTYLGVRSLLDGSATFVFFAAIIYSAAVSVAIYAFWSFMMRFVPLVRSFTRRVALFLVMALGSLMIVAMSSWLNAAALAGSAAQEQHLAVTLEGYAEDLDRAHASALAAQSLLPDLDRAEMRFSRLADNERQSGALTGSSGSGSVVQLLTQMSAQMAELKVSINQSRDEVANLFAEGSEHIATMRELVSATGDVQPRVDKFSAEAVQLSAVIAAMQETSVAPSVKRAAADLSLGFIAPVADGGTEDLVSRQDQVMETVRASVSSQSDALSAAADEILAEPGISQRRFVPLSAADAVLRYYADFLPSWAGAISIDLLPVVLVLVLMVVQDAIRRETDLLSDADAMTAGDMMRAVALYEEMKVHEAEREAVLPPDVGLPDIDHELLPTKDDGPEAESDGEASGNITPLKSGRRGRPGDDGAA